MRPDKFQTAKCVKNELFELTSAPIKHLNRNFGLTSGYKFGCAAPTITTKFESTMSYSVRNSKAKAALKIKKSLNIDHKAYKALTVLQSQNYDSKS